MNIITNGKNGATGEYLREMANMSVEQPRHDRGQQATCTMDLDMVTHLLILAGDFGKGAARDGVTGPDVTINARCLNVLVRMSQELRK